MIEIDSYLMTLIEKLKKSFQNRLIYVGLQGSYLRAEADENSDIDAMVVIDSITTEDLKTYQDIVGSMEAADRSCGFLCGREELKNWNPLEICHLVHTTKDYYGTLINLVPAYTTEDEKNYIKISLNNLYHALCHSNIHGEEPTRIETLKALYKSVFFILQNLYYLKNNQFYETKKELLGHLEAEDQKVLEKAILLKKTQKANYQEAFDLLFHWCQNKMIQA